jgi:alpha-glucosidase
VASNTRATRFQPLRNLRTPAGGPQDFRFAGRRQEFRVRVLAPDLFRLTLTRDGAAASPSWAVVRDDGPAVPVTTRTTGPTFEIATEAGTFALNRSTGAWAVHDRHRLPVFSASAGATGWQGTRPSLRLDLAPREAILGLGETTGTLDKRGSVREFWNIDVLGHAPAIHPGLRSLYVSIPFAISLRDGRAAGLFWDNPGRQVWDLGQTDPDGWSLIADTGVLDLYLFLGPTLPSVVGRYAEWTGRMPLPPRWALGYHQCRYSYESRAELEAVAREFRRRRIPCDALYCDIHHLDGHRVFTFGKSYPRPGEMLAGLARRGFKVVTIVDPGVKEDPRFGVLRRGVAEEAFVKGPDGRADFTGEVWPGRSRFPDFLREGVRAWWGREQGALQDLGVAGFWNDMNEPANFARPDKTLDPECVHRTDYGPRRHVEVHNVYGQEMARASYEGALRQRPAERPFVVTRAGYAGIQRYAVVWTGDNSSTWEHLAESVPMLLNLGLSGVPFVGADAGGFLDHATPELFVRWLQLAVFTPFLRNHSNLGTRRQEPWAFGPEVEDIARASLELRYQLHPYLYGLFAKAASDGTPIMRPLAWHHPNDPRAVACHDQFLLGPDLLVAPILRPGGEARGVYLPRGEWFDFWTQERHVGGGYVLALAPLARIPLFVRAGALLPLTPSRPFIGTKESDVVTLHLWPDDEARWAWYDDDGRSPGSLAGAHERRDITGRSGPDGGWLRVGARTGSRAGSTRTWRVVLRQVPRRFRVRVDGKGVTGDFVPELNLFAFEMPARETAVEASWR